MLALFEFLLSWFGLRPTARKNRACLPALFLLFLALPAYAGPLSAEHQTLHALLVQESSRVDDPDYNYELGLAALAAREYGIALNAFERVVLQRPEHAGAWLDMALTSYYLGDYDSARQFLGHMEASFDPPPPLRPLIVNLRTRLAAPPADWKQEVMLGFSLGASNNVNSGLSIDHLPLTLGGQRIDFALDPAHRPRSDSFLQADGSVRITRQNHPWRPQFFVTGQAREHRSEDDFDQAFLLAGAAASIPSSVGDWSIAAAHQGYLLGNSPLYRSEWFSGGHVWSRQTCVPGVGVELERRRYASLAALDGLTSTAWAGADCRLAGERRLQARLRLGRDKPLVERPGGVQHRQELSVSLVQPWRTLRFEASVRIARQRDQEGYSALLENNLARRFERVQFDLEARWPLAPGREAFIGLDVFRQNANLPLFDLSARTLQTGIRWNF